MLFSHDPVLSALAKVAPIILALALGLLITSRHLAHGASYSGKYLLSIVIALMGAGVTIDVLSRASPTGMAIMFISMAFAIWMALRMGR